MLKASMGGTCAEVENSDAACRMVPSPPKVAVRSTLSGRMGESDGSTGEPAGGAYTGKGRLS